MSEKDKRNVLIDLEEAMADLFNVAPSSIRDDISKDLEQVRSNIEDLLTGSDKDNQTA